MAARRKILQLLISEQKNAVLHTSKRSADSKKLTEITTSYLDDQEKQYSMDSEPAELEAEISLIDDPLATAETIGFQLEREKKKSLNALEYEEKKLNNLGSNRLALDSDGLDTFLSVFFDKINFTDTQSLSSPIDKDEIALEEKLSDLRAGKVARLSKVRPSPVAANHIGVPIKKAFFKHFKVDIKTTNSELINTKLYARRMFN
ncbi:hypothetical protein PRIPAC_87872 [Pristionchus pacificus]|uniref:Uncharacterized protein n=1 Tax=Pristionchus pacificus TaxID=54126 RepID=A0A454XZY3_PRIPA|nr:hypothetical protein PRIPAC_87872 [Pristionchus pacificus]|eukprot:PDM71131.1 hypothetical protein PRIPAC_43514 [Pristionchus pacificus]